MCVETKEAAALKLVLRDANKQRHVSISEGIYASTTMLQLNVRHSGACMQCISAIYNSAENYTLFTLSVVLCVPTVRGASGCGSFEGLPAGEHRVRAIARGRLPGRGGERYISPFYSFSTK